VYVLPENLLWKDIFVLHPFMSFIGYLLILVSLNTFL